MPETTKAQEIADLTERLMNWLSLAEPESYAGRADAFRWAARAHELALALTTTTQPET